MSSLKRRLGGASARGRSSPAAHTRVKYADRVNRCRNPFCHAILSNKWQRYCDANRICQLRRGLMLNCAWPTGPTDEDAQGKVEQGTESKQASSVERTAPSASPSNQKVPLSDDRKSEANGNKRSSNGKRAREDGESSDAPAASGVVDNVVQKLTKRPRSLQRLSSADSVLSTDNTSASPSRTVPTTAAQQIKNSNLEIVPLGVGNRTGGGGRYIVSGNRSSTPRGDTSEPSRTPVLNRANSAPVTTSTSAVPEAPAASSDLPPRVPSPSPLTSATSHAAPAIPSTTTNRVRDPRLRSTPSASSSSDAMSSVKRISAADYLSNRKTGEGPQSSSSSADYLSYEPSVTAESRPPSTERSLRRSQSDTTDIRTTSSHSVDRKERYDHPPTNSTHSYSRSSSSSTASPRPARPTYHPDLDSDRHAALERPALSRSLSSSSMPPRSSTPSNSHSLSRSSSASYEARPSSSSYDARPPSSSHDARPSSAGMQSTSSSSYREDHRERREAPRFPSLLEPVFSFRDPFLKLVLSRIASFLPSSLAAIRNRTKNPRKHKFYLEYVQRVHDYCGPLVKVSMESNVARVLISGREFLAVRGSSTTELYQHVLEELLACSERWYEVITKLKSEDSQSRRQFGGAYKTNAAFLKFWQAVKTNRFRHASELDQQSTYFRGAERHHWSFALGPVEIGSSSHIDKTIGFHAAASEALNFLLDLQIYDEREKYKVTPQPKPQTTSTERTETRSERGTSEATTSTVTASERTTRPSLSTSDAPPAAPVPDEVEAASEQRGHSDSWTGTNELQAHFSPVSEESRDDEEARLSDAMSVSDEEHGVSVTTRASRTADSKRACIFCEDMQREKPGAKCLRCLQRASNEEQLAAASSSNSASANRSVEALHAFLRQPQAASKASERATPAVTSLEDDTLQRLQHGLQSQR